MTELLQDQLYKVFGHANLKKIPSHYLDYLVMAVHCACGAVSALPAEPMYCKRCFSFTHSAYKDRDAKRH